MAGPFTPEQQARFDAELVKILAKYPEKNKAAAMIPLLRLCQDLLGWLPAEAMLLAAEKLEVPPARAEEVASFYTMLHTEPHGKYLVEVCTNVSCSLRGAEHLLSFLERKLLVKAGHQTADGRYTLRETECLASCGTAPCLQINEDHHEDLTPKKVEQILGSLA